MCIRLFTPRALALAGALAVSAPAWAQSLSPDAEGAFKRALEARIEGVTVLSGTAGSSAGLFRWKFSDIDLSVSKLNGLGDVGDPSPIGETGLAWNGVLGGAIASFTAHNRFLDTPLEGNQARTSGTVLSFEGGGHVYFGLGLSSRITLGLIYGRVKHDFDAETPIGQEVVDAGLGKWSLDTLTLAPSADLAWRRPFGRFTFQPSTRLIYFRTQQLRSSTDLLDVTGNSTSWNNQMDLDYKSPLQVSSYPIHFGAQFNRFDLGGTMRDGLKTDYFYSAELRALAELHGDLSIISYLGPTATYFWSNKFSGWSWAIQVNLKF
jgi:hypothetical protein